MIWNENRENDYCEITPALLALKEQWEKKNYIDPRLYKEYNVKRGLRDEDGRGVLTGLTRVAEIQSYEVTSGPDGEGEDPTPPEEDPVLSETDDPPQMGEPGWVDPVLPGDSETTVPSQSGGLVFIDPDDIFPDVEGAQPSQDVR